MKPKHLLSIIAGSVLFSVVLFSCKKDDTNDQDIPQLKKDILADAAGTVITTSYEDMLTKANALQAAVTTLNTTTTDGNLEVARTAWKNIRTTWEQTEAWLFGPVSTDDIDPRIDTWPVDFNALDDQLTGSNDFTEGYLDGLSDDLKGFHPIEYLLWGQNGNKTAASFTAREKEYLAALTLNLQKLTSDVRNSWTGGYANLLNTAGVSGNAEFPTIQSGYIAIVDAMAGICDEVANGKMRDPFDAQDPSQEESPFAKNSIIDFTNNITGILKIYQGQFINDGKGIEDLVRVYNLSLDNKIKTAHATAIASLQAVTQPFGQAISTQQVQVQNAMDKINELADILETELKPFLQQYAK